MTELRLRVISLGAGVQSTTMALMAAREEVAPMPDAAIFADTQSEPSAVYRHLDWLERQLPFPIHRVTAGSLADEILDATHGSGRTTSRPPFFTSGGGMLNRQCTQDFKLRPILRKIRELIGLMPRQHGPKEPVVEQWIGISIDEAIRMKASRQAYIRNRWPLIERLMSRSDCLLWCERHGYPPPPKSACTFCPYHDNAQWRSLRDQEPDAFREAIRIDEAIRPGLPGTHRRGDLWYVHRDRIPLADVDLSTAEERGQLNLFINECEGICGI